ncbi:hypothetical protein [Nitrosomonas sp. sh817]|uniref:hypothetical protein n=1 Tax=Nitrosomonas sp. sh817 TaxID=3070658 RepID=UPI0027DBEEAA|nr:hypothetical protein [Nitrosomonas sp. sh817]WMJ09491.1 hypothetical protein RBH92_04670 [Nitrosomonas sp. sh817]
MKLKLITLLAATAFLSACSSLPEAPQGQSNIKVGKSNVYWIDPATGKPGGYIVPRTASQKTKNDNYADANESVVISR